MGIGGAKLKLPTRLFGALGRLLEPTELPDETRSQLTAFLSKNIKKLVSLAEEMGRAEPLKDLIGLDTLDQKTLKALKKQLSVSTAPQIAALGREQ